MESGTLCRISDAEMVDLTGGGFWGGFLCGAGIIASAAAFLSPEPFSKVAAWSIYSGTAAACGSAFF